MPVRTVVSVVGARPNFMKLAPVARALAARPGLRHIVVHTGQHYDPEMSEAFFADLGLPRPEKNLGVGSGSHARQTAAILERFEPVCEEFRPDCVLVYGDVNSTVAAALVAAKLGVRVAHVEAGLRSRDWSMPEEVNRVVTDRLSTWLFAPSRDAVANLRAEGAAPERIHFVGNVMIDTLMTLLPLAARRDGQARFLNGKGPFVLVTLHRPANVDRGETLAELLTALDELAKDRSVIFPVHPRTRERIRALDWAPRNAGLALIEPLPYLDMLALVNRSDLVITDSGGLQEETTYLGIPCLTVRPNTERPITITEGTNRLVAAEREVLVGAARAAVGGGRRVPAPAVERWDGRAAERIADVLCGGAAYD